MNFHRSLGKVRDPSMTQDEDAEDRADGNQLLHFCKESLLPDLEAGVPFDQAFESLGYLRILSKVSF